jgi:metallophosphoesterase (TIGR00282 family)
MPPGNIGKGTTIYTLPDGRSLGVVNLLGRTFFHEQFDCPFRTGLSAIEQMLEVTRCIIVDFHAEATSEKKAFAVYVDGKVSAVLGTHTHVQTADETISSDGTAFITDVGMTGPGDSIIGMQKELVLKRFLRQTPVRLEPGTGMPQLNAVVLSINDTTGKTESIRRIFESVIFND